MLTVTAVLTLVQVTTVVAQTKFRLSITRVVISLLCAILSIVFGVFGLFNAKNDFVWLQIILFALNSLFALYNFSHYMIEIRRPQKNQLERFINAMSRSRYFSADSFTSAHDLYSDAYFWELMDECVDRGWVQIVDEEPQRFFVVNESKVYAYLIKRM